MQTPSSNTVLCWKSKLTTSGQVTVTDYNAWKAQGDVGRESIAEFFRERLRERYIEPVELLKPDQKNGFSIMAVACLLVETFETFYQGWQSSDNKSALAFCYFFDRENRFQDFRGYSAQFYKHVRCEILHQGETTGGWSILREGPLFDRSGLIVNATKFHRLLAEILDEYRDQLRREPISTKAWKNFTRKMDATVRNCNP